MLASRKGVAFMNTYVTGATTKALREGRKLTQAELSKNIGVSSKTVSKWETAKYMAACDYVGIVSGNKEPDKFAKTGFLATKSEFVDAPLIDELPMTVECKLISYDPMNHHYLVLGEKVGQAFHDGLTLK